MILKVLSFIERISARLQGKGWGSKTIKKEFTAVCSLFQTTPALCIDIGANKGAYTEAILSSYPNCKIVAFEPSLSNVKVLHKKFSEKSSVTIEQKAVSNISGEQILYSDCVGSGLASLTKRRLEHFKITFECREKVESVRFEEYWESELQSQEIDFVKLDIEGHELDALYGFGKALKHIKIIQFEFGGCNIDTRTFWQDFWYFFREHGYFLYRVTPFGKEKINQYKEMDEFFSTTNFLAERLSSRI